jgi:hypothetical protein
LNFILISYFFTIIVMDYFALPPFLNKQSPQVTKAERDRIEKMTWKDYGKELEDAEHSERLMKSDLLTKEEEKQVERDLKNIILHEAELRKDVIKKKDQIQKESSLVFDSIKIDLPDTLDKFGSDITSDAFKYIPEEVRDHLIDNRIIIHILAIRYLPYYVESYRKKHCPERLSLIVEGANSVGLGFRKAVFSGKEYFAVFFNFSIRRDEVLIKEFKSNKKYMRYEDIQNMDIDEKDEEDGDSLKKHESLKRKDEEEDVQAQDTIYSLAKSINGEKFKFNSQDVNSYIYSELMVIIFYKIDKEKSDFTEISGYDKKLVIFGLEGYEKVYGTFSFLLFVPNSS